MLTTKECINPKRYWLRAEFNKIMAIHPTPQSMLLESLPEMYLVAKYCVEFQKDTSIWPAPGCYGYPAALLLLSIVDSLGSYVIDTSEVKKHFDILNHSDYYNLGLNNKDVEVVYNKYRNLLNHNTVLATDAVLAIGTITDPVFENKNGNPYLNLLPFLEKTRLSLLKFLSNSNDIVTNSKQLQDILKK